MNIQNSNLILLGLKSIKQRNYISGITNKLLYVNKTNSIPSGISPSSMSAFNYAYSLFSCGRHVCMKARLITQGQIQHGGLSLLRCTFAPIIVALTREYHSTAFLIIRKGEPIRSLRFEEILMRILRYINELYLGVYFVVQFTVFAPDTAVHKRLFGTIRTRRFQENPHR